LKVSLENFVAKNCVLKIAVELGANCYSGGMRRNRADTATIAGISEVTAKRVRLSGEILRGLA
jgi:hypothetical protein